MEQETDIPAGRPAKLYDASLPGPSALAALVTRLEAAKNPAIVAGDDVARTDSVEMLVMLAEKLGAGVWFEGLRGRNSFPSDHPCYRGTLAFDAPSVAKQFAGNDCVLLDRKHTSELQSPMYLVCRLLLEKKKIIN